MEELRKLEEVQGMLTFMESSGFTASLDNDSNRFISNLILLLIKPCGDLNMSQKCDLISELMPKISPSFLSDTSLFFTPQGPTQMDNKLTVQQQSCFENVIMPISDRYNNVSAERNFEDMPTVGLDAMQHANSTLEDFCRSYFMFHGIDVSRPQSIFKYLPLLSFTESYIYQMDGLNEKIVDMLTRKFEIPERGAEMEANECWTAKFMHVFITNPFEPLVHQLECLGLMTERIKEEFRCGQEYWALERNLCSALIKQNHISIGDVMRAIHLKSFDYRVLNLLLYQLRGEKVNDLHMEFLSISEFLVEVSDDLFDYEDDVLENNFNVLRMFVGIYGPSGAPDMLAKYITEAEEKYENLLKALDHQLCLNYQKRCEEATKEGGKTSGHPFGTWSIPPVIVDEELYRSTSSKSK